MEPITPHPNVALNTSSKKVQCPFATTTRQKVKTYAYHQQLLHLRNYHIDQNLAANGLRRGQATPVGNNCLLHTLFQQIVRFVPKENLAGFISSMRERIKCTKGEQLSINDEEEGKTILVELQRYLFEKTGQNFCFDLTILFADNAGDLASVEMSDITDYLQQAGEHIPLRMIAVNYNHYEPLFREDDPSQLVEPFAALNMQPSSETSTRKADAKTLPAYVINMPIKVDSDEEGASSDEEEKRQFPEEAFKQPSEYFRLFPKDPKKAVRGKVLEILTSNPDPSLRPANPVASVIHLCEKEATSLQKGLPSTIHRLAMCVGFNKMRSLSRRRNRALNRNMNTFYDEKLPMGKIGFLWDGVWQRKSKDKWVTTTYEEVRTFYKQLKRRNPEKARKFRAKVEKSRGHMVLYREIRDAIKNHAETKRLVSHMRAQDKTRDVYVTFLDSDIKSFQQHPGAPSAFTVFDENYLDSRFEICSTGYAISEPDNPILELGVLADMTVRDATARHIRRGAYYPEPCTAVRVLPNKKTVRENFGDPSDKNYSSPQEMPRLIAEIMRRRKLLAQEAMRFDRRGAIVTTTPARMKRDFLARKVPRIGVILWSLPDFKTMSDINQSHFNARDWALNLIPALTLQEEITIPKTKLRLNDQKVIRDVVTSVLSRLFKAFNPIERALDNSRDNGSFQLSLIELLHSGKIVPRIEKASSRKQVAPRKNVTKDLEKEQQRCLAVNSLWKWADAIDTMPGLIAALNHILDQTGSSIRTETIIQAAEESGRQLVALFKARLCLNYVDLVVDALSKLLDMDYEALQAKLPALYRSIIEGYRVQGTVKTTRQEIEELPKFYGVTPLHIAALAGNLSFAAWLLEQQQGLSKSLDTNHLYPLDYGLEYCKNNGVNLDLLSALWKHMSSDSLHYFAQAILDELEDNADRLAVLDRLSKDKGSDVIQIEDPDLDFLVSAVMEGYEILAERLFECGDYPQAICQAVDDSFKLFIKAVRLDYEDLASKLAEFNDFTSELIDKMLPNAPNIDKKLLPWAEEFGIIDDMLDELSENEREFFKGNLRILGVQVDPFEPQPEASDDEDPFLSTPDESDEEPPPSSPEKD